LFNFGIKDRMTKWLNPDATQADIGETMQAYYDEQRKVWVFPGEDPEEKAKPIGAPPMTPAATTPGPATPAANDPLSAMMAPPKREVASNDPLAAMMAPPSRAKPKSLGATPNRMPPGMMPGAPSPMTPSFAVFKPKEEKS
jgi:hypothetical protein